MLVRFEHSNKATLEVTPNVDAEIIGSTTKVCLGATTQQQLHKIARMLDRFSGAVELMRHMPREALALQSLAVFLV